MSGKVVVNDHRVDKPGSLISNQAVLRVKGIERFVSRGGDKLWAAIMDLALNDDFRDKAVLDIGASTGGFTDCVLQLGAKTVVAVDVGTAQLDWKLRNHPSVISLEKTDIKDFKAADYPAIDWVLADVSFTSLAKLIPFIRKAAPKARLLLLVKPQFELPRDRIPDGGIVIEERDREDASNLVRQSLELSGYKVVKSVDAAITGRHGNREIFILASI
jgi:23S rRNA (cytidine1920-2'-O)/16S rRNA (cytidine1409-2'-O)-methyltransferase